MTTKQIATGVVWFFIIVICLIVLNIGLGILGFLFKHWLISLVLIGGGYYAYKTYSKPKQQS